MSGDWTPGPWQVDNTYQWPGKIRAESGRFICNADPHRPDENFNGLSQNMANARLIAAAPELYEALKALLELENNTSPFGGELQTDRVERTIAVARAALAKARGEGE